MEGKVLGAIVAHSKNNKDTIKDRQFKLRNLDGTFNEATQAFARWNVSGKRLKKFYKDHTTDETAEVKDEEAAE